MLVFYIKHSHLLGFPGTKYFLKFCKTLVVIINVYIVLENVMFLTLPWNVFEVILYCLIFRSHMVSNSYVMFKPCRIHYMCVHKTHRYVIQYLKI